MRQRTIYHKILAALLAAVLNMAVTHAESLEVTLTQAGTLPQHLTKNQLVTVTDLTLKGNINGTDVKCIRQMKVLAILDLTYANIVAGGETYYQNYQTEENVIGAYMFSYYDWNAPLTVCKLPLTTIAIGEGAFAGKNLLTDIHIQEGVKSIERAAFWSCNALANIQFPSSLEVIGDDAFNYCYALQHLYIPENVKEIKGNFTRNTQVSILEVDHRNSYYTSVDNVIFNKDQSAIIIYAPLKAGSSYTVPSTVRKINSFAFYYTRLLKEIILNQGLESIDYAAFYLSGIQSIHIPASLQSIYQGAFQGSALEQIYVESSNRHFSARENVLYNAAGDTLLFYSPAKSGTDFTVPENVVHIASESLPGNAALQTVQLPKSLQSISGSTFVTGNSTDSKNIRMITCHSVTPPEITVYDYLIHIDFQTTILYVPTESKSLYKSSPGWSRFVSIRGIGEGQVISGQVTAPGTLHTLLGEGVSHKDVIELTVSGPLNGTDIKFIRSMSKLEAMDLTNASIVEGGEAYYTPTWSEEGYFTQNNIIGTNMFRELPALITAHLPESVTRIETCGMAYCNNLMNLTLPQGLKSIGSLAFAGSKLSGDILPYYLEQIDSQAFQGCRFTTVYLSPNINSLTNPFDSCDLLQELWVHPDNPYYSSENGIMFNKDKTSLVVYPAGRTEKVYSVPESVNTIGSLAFSANFHLTKVTLPQNVTTIEYSAFAWCRNLQSINIPPSIKALKTQTFDGCSQLQSVTLPEGLETLEYWVFRECRSLKTIRIPQNVSSVPPYSLLNNCNGLTSIIWDAAIPIPQGIFADSDVASQPMQRNCLIYVKEVVSVPSGWKNIIRDGIADEINLSVEKQADGYAYQSDFHCPQPFTAKRITYSRDFTMESGRGDAGGWEGIVLPFTVQKFTSEAKGRIAPFNSGVAGAKNFWLRELTPAGFKAATALEANKPYIISMPNHSTYDEEFRLNGTVLFEAENVTIPVTAMQKAAGNRYSLVPAFNLTNQSDSVYALNLYSEYDGQKAGSVFVRNLRPINPFEAYAATNEEMYRAPLLYSIGGGDATGLKEELSPDGDIAGLKVSSDNGVLYLTSPVNLILTLYTANGCALRTIELVAKETVEINDLPKGIYLLQNRKVVIR